MLTTLKWARGVFIREGEGEVESKKHNSKALVGYIKLALNIYVKTLRKKKT